MAPYGSSVNVDPAVGVVWRSRDLRQGFHEVSRSVDYGERIFKIGSAMNLRPQVYVERYNST